MSYFLGTSLLHCSCVITLPETTLLSRTFPRHEYPDPKPRELKGMDRAWQKHVSLALRSASSATVFRTDCS